MKRFEIRNIKAIIKSRQFELWKNIQKIVWDFQTIKEKHKIASEKKNAENMCVQYRNKKSKIDILKSGCKDVLYYVALEDPQLV